MTSDIPFGERALITDKDFLPEETPEGYPASHNYKRDREAARLKAMGWSLDEIAEELGLTDWRTGDPDPRRAASAVQRGLSLVHQVNIDEKRLEQLQHYEMMKRHIWDSLNKEHVLVQQGKVIFQDGVPIEDRRFALEAFDRLNRIEESISKLLGTQAAQRFSVEADELSVEISQLISLINTDDTTTATLERLDTPALEAGEDT
jgi:transcriptional regulator with XRE-family HTH domain